MARYEFQSIFADEIKNYVTDKASSGFAGDNFRRNLIGFDKFCIEQKIQKPVFTAYHATKWLEQRENESHTTHYSRINASKHFLCYLSIKGYDVYVVRDIKYKGTDFQPHIYTDEETEKYFLAVDSYSSSYNPKDAIRSNVKGTIQAMELTIHPCITIHGKVFFENHCDIKSRYIFFSKFRHSV